MSQIPICLYICISLIVSSNTEGLRNRNKNSIAPCDCYMLGTIETKKGLSKCNEQAICECLPNVTGTKCDKCRYGYYGILEGSGCKACACNEEGSQSMSCHQSTGQCLCKDGYAGIHCEICDLVENISMGVCTTPCDWYRSVDPVTLFENGTCACKPHAIGKHCEKCEVNYYFQRTTSKCVECPSCYTFLAAKVNDAQEHLQIISESITNALESDENDKYAFVINLKTTQNNICSLLNTLRAQPAIQQIVKQKYLADLIDLTEKGIQVIALYLNGHINFHHLAEEVDEIEKMVTGLGQLIDSISVEDSANLNELAKRADDVVKDLIVIVKEYDNTNRKLFNDTNENVIVASDVLKKMKETQNNEFQQFFSNLRGGLSSSTDILDKVKVALHERHEIRNDAKNNYENANQLTLPEHVKHQVPFESGGFQDFSNVLENAKRKHDIINDVIKYLDTITPYSEYIKQMDDLYKEFINNIVQELSNINETITLLKSDIDKKYQELEEILHNIQNAKEQMEKIRQEYKTIKNFEEQLMEIIEILHKYKEKRKEIQRFIDEAIKLLEKIKEVQVWIDQAQETLKEFKYYEEDYKKKIDIMKEFIAYLQLIPVDDFDKVEQLLDEYDVFIKYIKKIKKERRALQNNVEELEIILLSLPDDYTCVPELT